MHVNFRALSGLHAVYLSILSLSSPNDVVWHFPKSRCGHCSTTGLLKSFGRISVEMPWDNCENKIDLVNCSVLCQKTIPDVILFDFADPIMLIEVTQYKKIVVHLRNVYGGTYIRSAVQEITRLGMQKMEIQLIADLIYAAITRAKEFDVSVLNNLILNFKTCHFTFHSFDQETVV